MDDKDQDKEQEAEAPQATNTNVVQQEDSKEEPEVTIETSPELVQLLEKFKDPHLADEIEIYNANVLKTTLSLLLSTEALKRDGAEDVIHNFLRYFAVYLEKKKDDFEITISLAVGIQEFIPRLYSKSRVPMLIKILEVFITSEEGLIKESALDIANILMQSLDDEDVNTNFHDLTYKLFANEWWKCSAIDMMAIGYPKLSDTHKGEIRVIYKTLINDDATLAKYAMARNYPKIIQYYDSSEHQTECIEMLETMANENHVSVRQQSVATAISLANFLDEDLIDKYICPILEKLVSDPSWKIRLEVAEQIVNIQKAVKPKLARILLISLLKTLCDDIESIVRKYLASKIMEVLIHFKETSNIDLDQIFDIVKELNKDQVDLVRHALLVVMMDATTVLTKEECKKYLLPLMKNTLMCQRIAGSQRIEEQCVYNVNKLIKILGYNALQEDIEMLMFDILSSGSKWRSRRRLIITIYILVLNSDEKYFTEVFLSFYKKILNDHCFAIRRIAPMILPVMVGKFGFEWGRKHILNWIFSFQDHPTYFQRYIVLYSIQELISPSLLQIKDQTEQRSLLNVTDDKDYLYQIYSLNEMLMFKLNQFEVENNVESNEVSSDLNYYGEEIIEELADFDVPRLNLLELLQFIIRHALPIFSNYLNDDVVNVANRTLYTYKIIIDLHLRISKEFSQEPFKDMFKELPKERTQSIESDILIRLTETDGQMDTNIEHDIRGEEFRNSFGSNSCTLEGDIKDDFLSTEDAYDDLSLDFNYQYDDADLDRMKRLDNIKRSVIHTDLSIDNHNQSSTNNNIDVETSETASKTSRDDLSDNLINDADIKLFDRQMIVSEFYSESIDI